MSAEKKSGGVLRNAAIVGGFTCVSRVLGLVREMLQSRMVGAGWEQSAFTLAFALPNMARKLFGEGALTAAFVPIFKGELGEGKECGEAAAGLARAVMTMSFAMMAAMIALAWAGTTVGLGFAPWGMEEGGEGCGRTELILRLVRLMAPYMLFICGAAFGMGVLNALGRFTAASMMPSLLNLFWIGALAGLNFAPGLEVRERVQWVAGAILVAGAGQMAFMMACMKRAGVSPALKFTGWGGEKVRMVWRNTAIGAVGAGAVQINYMLDQVLAQLAAPWAAGALGYADRLMDLPLGVVGVAFGTVLLPTFAGRFAAGDVGGAKEAFGDATVNMLFVMLPAAAGLWALAPEVTRVIYEGAAFDATATARVSRAVGCYAAGLGFFAVHKLLTPWFHAQKDMKTPLAVSVRMVFLNAGLNVAAVALLPVEWKHAGLAASTAVCSGAGCVALARRAAARHGSLGWRGIGRRLRGVVAASAGMAGLLLWARGWSAEWFAGCGLAGAGWEAVRLGGLVALGAGAFLGAMLAFNRRGLAEALRRLRRRGRKGEGK